QQRRQVIRRLSVEHGKRWCLYQFRHSFATRLFEAEVDALTVSALLGHANGAMLAKVHSHVSENRRVSETCTAKRKARECSLIARKRSSANMDIPCSPHTVFIILMGQSKNFSGASTCKRKESVSVPFVSVLFLKKWADTEFLSNPGSEETIH